MTREEGERVGKARGVVVGVDGDAAHGRRERHDAKAIGAERRPYGKAIFEKRCGPCGFESFGEAEMFGRRREAQQSVAERTNGAARVIDLGFAAAGRMEEGELDGDDFAGRRLNGGDEAGKATGFVVAVGSEEANGFGRLAGRERERK